MPPRHLGACWANVGRIFGDKIAFQEKCKNNEFYDEANLISLRNTTLANYMNGCSISIPYFENKKPIGIMLNATTNEDDDLLRISSKIEKILEK